MSDTMTTRTRSSGEQTSPGQLLGSAIGGVFGLIYVELNAGPLPAAWPVTLRIAGGAAAAGLALLLLRAHRAAATGPALDQADPGLRAGFGRRYWFIVAGEVAAIWAGSALLSGPAGRPQAVVAWVSVVVGVHFLWLAALWQIRLLGYLGTAIALCGIAGLAAAFASAPAAVTATAGGVLPGILLLAAAYRGAGGAIVGRPVR